jgi:hypothetical protein
MLIAGKAQTGKTTEAVHLIMNKQKSWLRIIVLCPTWYIQKTFDPIRKFVKDCDVYTKPTDNVLRCIIVDLESKAHTCKQAGLCPMPTLILIDDMAGSSLLHGNRKGTFANLSIQTTHWNLSIIVISQQSTSVDPNFRDNTEHTLVFYSEREDDYTWMKKAFNSSVLGETNFKEIVKFAWSGGGGLKEYGKHFLYIKACNREPTRFFIDWCEEIALNK